MRLLAAVVLATMSPPVVDRLPKFRHADPPARLITVRHLLNQTSGMADPTTDIPRTWEAKSLAELVEALDTATLSDEPAGGHRYARLVAWSR